MDKQKPRLIGSDGELIVPVVVEKTKRQPGDSRRLTNRVSLMVLALIVLFGGLALGVVIVQRLQTATTTPEPSIAIVPARFANGPYRVTLNANLDMKNLEDLPCAIRRIQVSLEANTILNMRLEAAPDHGSYRSQTGLAAVASFDIPATEGDLFNLWLYDSQNMMVAALESIQIGTSDFPICSLAVTFSPSRG